MARWLNYLSDSGYREQHWHKLQIGTLVVNLASSKIYQSGDTSQVSEQTRPTAYMGMSGSITTRLTRSNP